MGKKKLPHESLSDETVALLNNLQVNAYFYFGTNNVTMQDIITFLDSPKLLLQLPKIRDQLGIKSVPFDSMDTLVDLPGPLQLVRDKSKPISKYSFTKILTSIENWRNILDYWHPPNHPKRKLLIKISTEILSSMNRPYYLGNILFQAIILGVAGWNQDPIVRVGNDQYLAPGIAIMVTPRTTYDDIKEAIRSIKKQNFDKYDLPDYVQHIMDYRHWYWEKLSGLTYSDIADRVSRQKHDEVDKAKSEDPSYSPTKEDLYGIDLTEVGVVKGVKKYVSLLEF